MVPEQKRGSRRLSVVDLGAAAAISTAAGLIWSPEVSTTVAKATGKLQPVIVTVDVRGVPVADAAALLASIREEGKVSIVIRNQPHGSVSLRQVVPLQRKLSAVQPDGRVVTALMPQQAEFGTLDARFQLEGQGRRSGGGVVFGNQNLKIGAPIELEGSQYRVMGTVTNLSLGGQQ